MQAGSESSSATLKLRILVPSMENFCENRMEWYLPGGSGRSGSHCSRTLPELLPGLVGYPGIPGHPGST